MRCATRRSKALPCVNAPFVRWARWSGNATGTGRCFTDAISSLIAGTAKVFRRNRRRNRDWVVFHIGGHNVGRELNVQVVRLGRWYLSLNSPALLKGMSGLAGTAVHHPIRDDCREMARPGPCLNMNDGWLIRNPWPRNSVA